MMHRQVWVALLLLFEITQLGYESLSIVRKSGLKPSELQSGSHAVLHIPMAVVQMRDIEWNNAGYTIDEFLKAIRSNG